MTISNFPLFYFIELLQSRNGLSNDGMNIIGWKVYMMTSYQLIFFTNGIQTQQHHWKKWADRK